MALTNERIREIWAQATGEREPLVYIVGQAMDAFARAVEREARREALEAAAAECKRTIPPPDVLDLPAEYAPAYSNRLMAEAQGHLNCITAIRALSDKEPRT